MKVDDPGDIPRFNRLASHLELNGVHHARAVKRHIEKRSGELQKADTHAELIEVAELLRVDLEKEVNTMEGAILGNGSLKLAA
jgi:hypothetical protein